MATGYTDGFEGGCLFINEEGTANLWSFDLEGNLKDSKTIDIEGMSQGARVTRPPFTQSLKRNLATDPS